MSCHQRCSTDEEATIWWNHDQEGIITSTITEMMLLFAFSITNVYFFDYFYSIKLLLVFLSPIANSSVKHASFIPTMQLYNLWIVYILPYKM